VFGVKNSPETAIIFEYPKAVQEVQSRLRFGGAPEPAVTRRFGSKDAEMPKNGTA
jgi:hypothetical protein